MKAFIPVVGDVFSIKKAKRGWNVYIQGHLLSNYRYFYVAMNVVNEIAENNDRVNALWWAMENEEALKFHQAQIQA